MHYRNGREANNGDKIVQLNGGKVVAFGVLHSATAGNDYCNGNIAVVQGANECACMCDCTLTMWRQCWQRRVWISVQMANKWYGDKWTCPDDT